MTRRATMGGLFLFLVIGIAAALWVGPSLTAAGQSPANDQVASARRQAIKQMPILTRPNRVGHVYGNTVRRRYYRQTGGR